MIYEYNGVKISFDEKAARFSAKIGTEIFSGPVPELKAADYKAGKS